MQKVLVDYENHMKVAARAPEYVSTTLNYIRKAAVHGEWKKLGDINPDSVLRWAATLKDEGMSSCMIRGRLTALKGFTTWLVKQGKLKTDPLVTVSKPTSSDDRRHVRRMLLPEEWSRLRDMTRSGPVRFGMSGQARVLLYATAIQTGLRASELRSLKTTDLFLKPANGDPFILCKGGSTKNGKDARQFINRELVEELRVYQSTRLQKPGVVLFDMPAEDHQAEMLRKDLEDARKIWLGEVKDDPQEFDRRMKSDFLQTKNNAGEVLDFHSLRHTCGAWLAQAGCYPQTIQAIMRHSTINLTMNTYGHLFPGQEAQAIAKLPAMMSSTSPTGWQE